MSPAAEGDPLRADRQARRRLVLMLLKRGDIGAELVDERRRAAESLDPAPADPQRTAPTEGREEPLM